MMYDVEPGKPQKPADEEESILSRTGKIPRFDPEDLRRQFEESSAAALPPDISATTGVLPAVKLPLEGEDPNRDHARPDD